MEEPSQPAQPERAGPVKGTTTRVVLAVACLVIVAIYASLANLKGIGTDEGFRLGIINGGREFTADEPATRATWEDVLTAIRPYAYQPLYFLLQNTVMRVTRTHDELVLKSVNIFFLWLSLQGLLALSRAWPLVPRLFLLGIFSLNAYLFMHVLQLREYIVGIAFYVWSSWLALRLDRRPLRHSWADTGWFAGYGGLLVLGFYTQTWAVFPACGQGLFLMLRRAGDRLRFFAHLALSYVIVLSFTLPYLQSHSQKVNIGRWGDAAAQLWPRLADGFHLVLSGHLPGQSPAADFFFWFWLLLLTVGAGLFVRGKFRAEGDVSYQEYQRQGLLMLLSLGIAVAFQIGYFLKVDTLSVWPRYFALHYFFLIWLLALAFRRLYDAATAETLLAPARRRWRLAVGASLAVLLISGVFQVRSYCRNPYFDTGLSPASNWRVLSAGLARILKPGDVVLTQDFLHAWTLTFTRPLPNQVLSIQKIGPGPFAQTKRFVYLESDGNLSALDGIAARLRELGFGAAHDERVPAADSPATVPGWRLVIFQRR